MSRNFKKQLNSEQLRVVLKGSGPCLVLAGAGSGKTRTIVYRVAHLLVEGIPPDNILLVTFTNKAAREMKERIGLITNGDTALPWSGTFHHIAYRLLKRYAAVLGYENNFTILDSADSLDLIKICLKQEGIDRKQRRFPSAKVLRSIISYAQNAQTTIEDVLDLKHEHWLELAETIERIAVDYQQRKVAANAMDFDDLLTNLHLLLLKSKNVREKYSKQFQYILVDEYQDTNKVQASIVRLFAGVHKNILVVGDDAQSIYSFRAADIENILDFENQYKNAQTFRLETNYRSTPNILDVANVVIANNSKQYTKELKSVVDEFTKPEVHEFADDSEEAEFITNRILELIDEGVKPNKISVLFRAAFHSQALEVELSRHNIAYDFRGGVRFFERAHIKDVLAYLRILSNKSDAIAWSRVLNMQIGIGPAGAQKVFQQISGVEEIDLKILQEAGSVLSARGQMGWSDFLQIYEKTEKTDGSPSGLIEGILESKYLEYLENEYPDYRERKQDIEQLAEFAKRAKDLSTFLAEATMQENYTRNNNQKNLDDSEKIILSTVHQAKGLEWEAVFVIGLSAGRFPHDRATGSGELEEERRLFYVAITRAKKYLYLTYPLVGRRGDMLMGPSMFLDEIDRDLIDENKVGGSTVFGFNDPSDDVDDITYEPVFDDKPRKSFLKSLDDL